MTLNVCVCALHLINVLLLPLYLSLSFSLALTLPLNPPHLCPPFSPSNTLSVLLSLLFPFYIPTDDTPETCIYSNWSPWSACSSATCDKGKRMRQRMLKAQLDLSVPCPHTQDFEPCMGPGCSDEGQYVGLGSSWDMAGFRTKVYKTVFASWAKADILAQGANASLRLRQCYSTRERGSPNHPRYTNVYWHEQIYYSTI